MDHTHLADLTVPELRWVTLQCKAKMQVEQDSESDYACT